MKTLQLSLLAAVVLGIGLLSPTAPGAESDEKGSFPLEGTWRWNFTMPDGSVVRPKLKLTTEKGEITGTTSFRPAGDRGSGRGPGGRGGGGGRGPGGGRGFETRVELEQDGTKLTGKTVGRFGRPVAITNAFYTNGVIYFEIERTFFDNRTLTKYQ